MLHPKVNEFLESLTADNVIFSHFNYESIISDEINNILNKNKNYQPTYEDQSEKIAFNFSANYPNNDSGWGTYYGPMFVTKNNQGQFIEYPSIKSVTIETIKYWQKRDLETNNPFLFTRYCDLIIDFSGKLNFAKPKITYFHKVIDGHILISKNQISNTPDSIIKIERALTLSLKINDTNRIKRVSKAIIDLENIVEIDDKPGLWGFSLRLLVLENGEKIKLSNETVMALISDLENRLERVKHSKWLIENVVVLLAEYYAFKNDNDNLLRVLKVLENTFKSDNRSNSNALLKINTYQQLQEIYQKYASKFKSCAIESKRILKEISSLNIDWKSSMKKVSSTISIKKEDIEKSLNDIFIFKGKFDLHYTLTKIAITFIPRKESLKQILKNTAKKNPIQYLATTQIISDDGIPIAKLSSLENDFENHLKKFSKQNIQFQSYFLSLVLKRLKDEASNNVVFDFFKKSLLFQDQNLDYLERSLNSYWVKDYIVSSHLFIPIIETTIRKLIEISGGIILKPNNLKGYDRVLLNRLLSNKNIFSDVFQDPLGNILSYFELVLNQKLGMNLRNDFAHGFGKAKFFSEEVSNILFHIIILLSLVKLNDTDL